MKRNLYLFSMVLIVLSLSCLAGQTENPMEKLTPFIGKWKTLSTYPGTGLKVPGEIEYRWVLGKTWVHLEFQGEHPQRPYWEAYVMMTYDAGKKQYLSHAFYGPKGPTVMTGRWITTQTISFEMKTGKGRSGIDYTVKPGGSIYQENWVMDGGGKRRITLQTDYTLIQ